jgi:hypothetical protein
MRLLHLSIICVALFTSTNVIADTLQLMDNQKLKGKVISIDNINIHFELGGQKLNIERIKVKSIVFDPKVAPIKVPSITEPVKVNKSAVIVIPNGTPMMVKMMSTVNSVKHSVGYKFTSRLEANITIDGVIAAPRGTVIYGVIGQAKQSNRLVGNSNVEIHFTDMRINNVLVPIKTSSIKTAGSSTTKSTVSRTARFAAIGGLANGSKGAENAAKAGLGTSLLTSGSTVNIPTGTLLEFTLTAAVNIT